MKTCKRCGQNKPKSAFRPDPRYRDGYGSWCAQCHRDRALEWSKENQEHVNNRAASWRKANHDAVIAADRKYKSLNRDKVKKVNRTWRLKNLKYDCARVMARYAHRMRAIPPWADKRKIAEIYRNKPKGMQVDHIIPLKSKMVCGLHCEANLQYLTPSENQSKKNYRWPDMPDITNAQRQAKLFDDKPKAEQGKLL